MFTLSVQYTNIGNINLFSRSVFPNETLIITSTASKMQRRNVECADLISTCDVWCHTSGAVIKTPIVGKCKQNHSYLTPFKRLSASSDTQNGPQPHLKISSKSLTLI